MNNKTEQVEMLPVVLDMPQSVCFKRKRNTILLILFILLSLSKCINASCSLRDGDKVTSIVIPLSGTMSISNDMATKDLTSIIIGRSLRKVRCTTSNPFYGEIRHSGTEVFTYFFDKYYKTNFDGIGFYFAQENAKIPNTLYPIKECLSSDDKSICADQSMNFNLLKYGNVKPGILYGSSIPVIKTYVGQSDSMVLLNQINFSGSITFTLPTCKTPDVIVEMDSHPSSEFTGKGSTTAWKNANIILSDCGVFNGYGTSVSYRSDLSISSGHPSNTIRNNNLGLSITPLNGVIDRSKGIMAISPTPGSARGIGIQLGYGDTNSAESDLIDFATIRTHILPKDGTKTISIPISARYIQTEDNIKPGKADGKLTFMITYK
ncbi:type 1 fimbrial protein (plasmid) [Klebsiella aerogenes]|uniref:fimbrial protein n=1 Tax=Klebsiella aerogenes TaxID=548 RepID=UPI00124F72FF|nr:fimbrial protein [Klebsiella aerogenes]QFI19948.1 type 1 fimbrial protein [Klebsiella aerogenes]